MHWLCWSGLGTLFFVGTHVTIRKFLQKQKKRRRFRKFSDASIYYLSCCSVSIIQGMITFTVGAFIAALSEDMPSDNHWLTFSYAGFVLPYFPYDLWAIYAYKVRVYKYQYENLDLKKRIIQFIKTNKMITAHHLFIPCVLMPIVFSFKRNKEECFLGSFLMANAVIPSILAREFLGQHPNTILFDEIELRAALAAN